MLLGILAIGLLLGIFGKLLFGPVNGRLVGALVLLVEFG
jgi:hypothetical protein